MTNNPSGNPKLPEFRADVASAGAETMETPPPPPAPESGRTGGSPPPESGPNGRVDGPRFSRRKILLLFAASLLVSCGIGLILLFSSLPDVSDLRTRNPRDTALIRARKKAARERGDKLDFRQEWVTFDRIPGLFKTAVRVSEDANFYFHKGIDFVEIREAVKANLRKGRAARGGSTITQQLAKNLYLSTDKSLFRKAREVLIARRLERTLSKDRIFFLYLNVIEFGPGTFGVQAAARRYFDCDVGSLNLEQILRLTAVIPRPLTVDPRGRDRWLMWRCRWILGILRTVGAVPPVEYEATLGIFEEHLKGVTKAAPDGTTPAGRNGPRGVS